MMQLKFCYPEGTALLGFRDCSKWQQLGHSFDSSMTEKSRQSWKPGAVDLHSLAVGDEAESLDVVFGVSVPVHRGRLASFHNQHQTTV